MTDDGFEEIFPPSAKAGKLPSTIKCRKTTKTSRVTLTFRLDLVDEDTAHILRTGPRFNIAFNAGSMALRVAAKPDGRYEANPLPKTDGLMLAIHFPLPDKMAFHGDVLRIDPDPNRQQNAIFIDLPPVYAARKLADAPMPKPAAPAPAPSPDRKPFVPPLPRTMQDVTAAAMGDPPPGRSALAARKL